MLSDPTSRKPERRPGTVSDDRLELRAPFPDDERGLWALATFTRRAAAAVESSSTRSTCVQPIYVVGVVAVAAVMIDDEAADACS